MVNNDRMTTIFWNTTNIIAKLSNRQTASSSLPIIIIGSIIRLSDYFWIIVIRLTLVKIRIYASEAKRIHYVRKLMHKSNRKRHIQARVSNKTVFWRYLSSRNVTVHKMFQILNGNKTRQKHFSKEVFAANNVSRCVYGCLSIHEWSTPWVHAVKTTAGMNLNPIVWTCRKASLLFSCNFCRRGRNNFEGWESKVK